LLKQYFLGAQIDVSGIVKDCPGLEAYKHVLSQEAPVEPQTQVINGVSQNKNVHDRVHTKLDAFLDKLSPDEIANLRAPDTKSIPRNCRCPSDKVSILIDTQDAPTSINPTIPPRLAGCMPGVYQNYLIVSPYPFLHILFASPALQNAADLRQTRLLTHISPSPDTLISLANAFANGVPVAGQVMWKPAGRAASDAMSGGSTLQSTVQEKPGSDLATVGQSQWMGATPLVGRSDGQVGVWVIIMINLPHESAVGELF
jgi:hypothetical protein